MDFAISADHRMKIKESVKIKKYQDLAKVLKKLQNVRVTVVSIIVCALGMVLKGSVKLLEEFEIKRRIIQEAWNGLL